MIFLKRFIILILICLIAISANSQIKVSGVYQGKNLYIENPFSGSGTFCAKRITINGQSAIENVDAMAFEIDLRIYNFEIGDSVEIIISHSNDCLPKVLNPEIIGKVTYGSGFAEFSFGDNRSQEFRIDDSLLTNGKNINTVQTDFSLNGYWIITSTNEKHFKEITNHINDNILKELYNNPDPPEFEIIHLAPDHKPTSKDTLIRVIDLPGNRVYYSYREKWDITTGELENLLPIVIDSNLLKLSVSDTNHMLYSGNFHNSKREGIWKYYFKDGSLKSKIIFKKGMKQGAFVTYHRNGSIEELGQWYRSRFYGDHYNYFSNGNLSRTSTYDENGRLIGMVRNYNEKNGQIEQIVTFQQGHENGFALQFDSISNLTRALYFSEGKRIDTLITDSTELNSLVELALVENKNARRKYQLIDANKDIKTASIKALEHESTISSQKYMIYFSSAFLIVFLLASVLIFRSYQAKNKAHKEIELQKEIVDEKNKEIMDSINYAKRIQSAILPSAKLVKEYLKQSFILYKPKDVVAGDFYWMEHQNHKVLFAAADCTGHGVPGAMVSVVCNNALNRSVREYGLTDPGEILDKTREIVINEFDKSEEDVKDGMDIAICSLEGNTLKYAGAHNPLWIIRKGSETIEETKANKQPIGKFDLTSPYTTHTFELQKGDSVYIFSDGFVDQFGGPKGKKFKARAFRELLLSIQDIPMEDQSFLIDKAFEKWRGGIEQIDDVCVIGVRI